MPEDLYIHATPSSPEIDFRYSQHILILKGESYPENAAKFYCPVLQSLSEYLGQLRNQRTEVSIALTYFNSSSTKVLCNIICALDNAVSNGNRIIINWYYDEDDDSILEFGQELHEDYAEIEFNPVPMNK